MKKFLIYIQVLKQNEDTKTISIHNVDEEVINGETWKTAIETKAPYMNDAEGLLAARKDSYNSHFIKTFTL